MSQESFKKIRSGVFYGSFLLLFAYCISMYAFFYTGNCIPNYHSIPGSEINTCNEIIISNDFCDNNNTNVDNTIIDNIITSNSNIINIIFDTPYLIQKASSSGQKSQEHSILSLLTELLGSGLFELLIFAIILLLRVQAVILPDAFSLINRKVRLND